MGTMLVNQKLEIQTSELLEMFGCLLGDLPEECVKKINSLEPGYRLATSEEKDDHILLTLKLLGENRLSRTPSENKEAFERGWQEILELCMSQGISPDSLRPQYVKPYEILRFNGQFIVPDDRFLLEDLLSIATTYSFKRYLYDVENIYEFGCGTGRYLLTLSDLFSDKELTGLDWAEPSMKILEMLANTGRKVKGAVFDMLDPAPSVHLEPHSAVVTIGALEQLGDRFEKFLSYLVANKPDVVIHHEPIMEFYEDNTLFDYLASSYHQTRGYLSGYWTALKALETEGKIEVLESRRMFYGNPYHEPHSFIVWRPIR